MSDIRETVLEIDLSALEHNYRYLRAKLKPHTAFLAVLKAFAYGNEAVAIAKRLEVLGAEYFAVAYAREGISLRIAGIQTPILVLHPQPVNFDSLIEHNLEPALYSLSVLNGFTEAVRSKGLSQYPVHLKFNTGLNRLGLLKANVPEIVARLAEGEQLKIRSVFSHLAASEDPREKAFTKTQIANYLEIAALLEEALSYTPLKHILNTSGILNYPEAQLDMVRSGIGLYGYGNEEAQDALLRPVASLKTIISQVHSIPANESVGYNRGYTAAGNRLTATLPLGHADGIGRHYGHSKGWVWINGRKAFIIGNVCMDMIMVDVSDIPCKEGDEVLVFGKDASAEELARAGGTISYELISGISQRVKRSLRGE